MQFDTPADLPAESRAREKALSAFLTAHGISGEIFRHPPVFTVAESQQHCAHIPGAHVKNLVVKDKAGRTALVTVSDTKRVDLKALAQTIGFGRLSFVRPEPMTDLLGVDPGSVTPLAVINAPVTAAHAPLLLVIDQDLWEADHVAMHPLHNAATLVLAQADLRRVFSAAGYSEDFRRICTIPVL